MTNETPTHLCVHEDGISHDCHCDLLDYMTVHTWAEYKQAEAARDRMTS